MRRLLSLLSLSLATDLQQPEADGFLVVLVYYRAKSSRNVARTNVLKLFNR
jgi:hypothetical protein